MPLIDVPTVHAVTNAQILADPGFLTRAREVADALGTSGAIHLRGPGVETRRLFELGQLLCPIATRFGCRIVVNDRLDVAQAAGSWGVQLKRTSLLVSDARKVSGQLRLGASVHSEVEAREAAQDAPDWLFAGSAFATESHPGRPPLGEAELARIASLGTVIAIGGVTPERVSRLREIGFHGVAAISGIWTAPNPGRAAESYR